jgi:hypothetical protein
MFTPPQRAESFRHISAATIAVGYLTYGRKPTNLRVRVQHPTLKSPLAPPFAPSEGWASRVRGTHSVSHKWLLLLIPQFKLLISSPSFRPTHATPTVAVFYRRLLPPSVSV